MLEKNSLNVRPRSLRKAKTSGNYTLLQTCSKCELSYNYPILLILNHAYLALLQGYLCLSVLRYDIPWASIIHTQNPETRKSTPDIDEVEWLYIFNIWNQQGILFILQPFTHSLNLTTSLSLNHRTYSSHNYKTNSSLYYKTNSSHNYRTNSSLKSRTNSSLYPGTNSSFNPRTN